MPFALRKWHFLTHRIPLYWAELLGGMRVCLSIATISTATRPLGSSYVRVASWSIFFSVLVVIRVVSMARLLPWLMLREGGRGAATGIAVFDAARLFDSHSFQQGCTSWANSGALFSGRSGSRRSFRGVAHK